MVRRLDSEPEFSLPDRRLVRALGWAVLVVVALAFTMSQLWVGNEGDSGWTTVSRFLVMAIWLVGAYYFASRCRTAWRDYRNRNGAQGAS